MCMTFMLVIALLIRATLLPSILQSRLEDWGQTFYAEFSEHVRVKRAQHGRGPWFPAVVDETDRKALLLHDIELATNQSLLVSFDKSVYVTFKQRKQIARYLKTSRFESGVASEVFAKHGYRLVTTRK